jgi:HPt (histidine-containing phosphotransfer) domain-containing protein
MNDYLSKPIDRSALENVLKKYIGRRAQWIDSAAFDDLDDSQEADKPDLVVELIDSFARTSGENIKKMNQFTQEGKWELLKREAHAMKSGAWTLGARELGQWCDRIEKLSETASRIEFEKHFEELHRAQEASVGELMQIRTQRIKRSRHLLPRKKRAG